MGKYTIIAAGILLVYAAYEIFFAKKKLERATLIQTLGTIGALWFAIFAIEQSRSDVEESKSEIDSTRRLLSAQIQFLSNISNASGEFNQNLDSMSGRLDSIINKFAILPNVIDKQLFYLKSMVQLSSEFKNNLLLLSHSMDTLIYKFALLPLKIEDLSSIVSILSKVALEQKEITKNQFEMVLEPELDVGLKDTLFGVLIDSTESQSLMSFNNYIFITNVGKNRINNLTSKFYCESYEISFLELVDGKLSFVSDLSSKVSTKYNLDTGQTISIRLPTDFVNETFQYINTKTSSDNNLKKAFKIKHVINYKRTADGKFYEKIMYYHVLLDSQTNKYSLYESDNSNGVFPGVTMQILFNKTKYKLPE